MDDHRNLVERRRRRPPPRAHHRRLGHALRHLPVHRPAGAGRRWRHRTSAALCRHGAAGGRRPHRADDPPGGGRSRRGRRQRRRPHLEARSVGGRRADRRRLSRRHRRDGDAEPAAALRPCPRPRRRGSGAAGGGLQPGRSGTGGRPRLDGRPLWPHHHAAPLLGGGGARQLCPAAGDGPHTDGRAGAVPGRRHHLRHLYAGRRAHRPGLPRPEARRDLHRLRHGLFGRLDRRLDAGRLPGRPVRAGGAADRHRRRLHPPHRLPAAARPRAGAGRARHRRSGRCAGGRGRAVAPRQLRYVIPSPTRSGRRRRARNW